MIVSSFTEQYGIRLYYEYDDISLQEFNQLLTGISEKTALGKTVSIRAEKNKEIIEHFGDYEKQIRRKWQEFKYKNMDKEKRKVQMINVQDMFKALARKV